MSSNLRPYYDPATFRSPIKGYDELGLGTARNFTQSGDIYSLANSGPSSGGGGSGSSNFEYLDNLGETRDQMWGLLGTMMRRYGSNLAAQPMNVCRLLLQVGDWGDVTGESTTDAPYSDEEEDDEEDNEMDYFTAVTGKAYRQGPDTTTAHKRQASSSPPPGKEEQNPDYPNMLQLNTVSSQELWTTLIHKDGIMGVFRAVNASFFVKVLGSTLEAWLCGFLSSVTGVPDPQFVDILHSPNPWVSLATVASAGVVTAMVLAPVDTINTRMIVTTFDCKKHPRSLRTSLRQLRDYIAPWTILLPTMLLAGLNTTIKRFTPYLLYTQFGVDNYNSQFLYNTMVLLSDLVGVVLGLPIETIKNRAQVHELGLKEHKHDLLVKPVRFKGFGGTIWAVLTNEDPVSSLFRGWRVSLAGKVSEWGISIIERSNQQSAERF